MSRRSANIAASRRPVPALRSGRLMRKTRMAMLIDSSQRTPKRTGALPGAPGTVS